MNEIFSKISEFAEFYIFPIVQKILTKLILLFEKFSSFQLIVVFAIIACICFLFLGLLLFRKRKDAYKPFLTNTTLAPLPSMLKMSVEYIQKNCYSSKFSLEEMSKKLVINLDYLAILFREEMDIRLDDFISQVRINKARQLYNKEKPQSDNELAESVGFESIDVFYKNFKIFTGMTFEEFEEFASR